MYRTGKRCQRVIGSCCVLVLTIHRLLEEAAGSRMRPPEELHSESRRLQGSAGRASSGPGRFTSVVVWRLGVAGASGAVVSFWLTCCVLQMVSAVIWEDGDEVSLTVSFVSAGRERKQVRSLSEKLPER